MEQFHRNDWQGRREIAERLSDKRLREHARRLLYMEAPETLSDGARATMDAWMSDRLLTEEATVPWNTIPIALRDITEMLADANDHEAALLNDFLEFLQKRQSELDCL
jgi:exodeoxyribonuclease-1